MAVAETIYERLTSEEDARVCLDIDESACRESPQSFSLILASYFLTKLGEAIASPKTTLAWLVTAVGAPAFVLGLLVPIRESGSMIPQLFIGGAIRQLPLRKWVWVLGSVAQGSCILGIGLVALFLEGRDAGWAILVLIGLFSLARGFCSVAAKDVLGKTIPRNKRGQLNGWSASGAGLLSVALGLVLVFSTPNSAGSQVIATILILAGLLWAVAGAVYARVPEFAGETAGGRNALEALGKLNLLVTDKPFRRFVVTRALLMCSALSAPFYVALAQQNQGSLIAVLGAFVIAAGLASLLSAPVWGRFADRSSKQVMVAAALITATTGIGVFVADRYAPGLSGSAWFLPLAYFVLNVAHSGVRIGRKTYVVNLGRGNERTDYVAISNSVIGVLLLLVGMVGALAPLVSVAGVISLLALLGLAGSVLGTTLPDTNRDEAEVT